MKYKKYSYILVFILMLLVGMNGVYAESTECIAIFGSKSDPNSIRYLLNEILMYPKIIVPILVIVLGTLDLAKAVISGKEDGMKKAQATFIKRVLLGVVIFFVPTIVDIIMYFADLVWTGFDTSCRL